MQDFQQLTDHIFRLELRGRVVGPLKAPVAVWLVRAGEAWTLVDTALPDTSDQLVAAIVRATGGRGPDRILLTHAHYDHAGGLAALRLAWNPPLMCHREEVPFLTGAARYRQLATDSVLARLGRPLMKNIPFQVPVAKDLEGGQSADGMVVIHLPGHSPGQVGFLHPTDRAVICGDAVMNLFGRLGPPLAITTPDPARAAASMVRLGELDFEHLFPSHGPPILARGRETMLTFLRAHGLG